MIKAVAAMMGGMINPPVEAAASIPPACAGANPAFFIKGMVKVPVTMTFAAGAPVTVPKSALATTEVMAGPPASFRPASLPISVKNPEAPETDNNPANTRNKNRYVDEISSNLP